jgi:required for meiotic nuclear division protein 1
MLNITAYQIAESIDIKRFKTDFTSKLLSSSSFELFYEYEEKSYLYLFNYGVVIFADFSEIDESKVISFMEDYTSTPFAERLSENFQVNIDSKKPLSFSYNSANVPEINNELIKICMLNVGHSVVLDYYLEESRKLLFAVTDFTTQLEKFGKIDITKREMLKFIGKVLNTKNKIIDELYILDSPDILWENEYLSNVNNGMSKTFELRTRFREIEYHLKIIEDNLNNFREVLHHRENRALEIIIIVLILIEVFDLIFSKIFKYL